MSRSAASSMSRHKLPWLRKSAFAVHLAACFLFVTLAVVFVGIFERNGWSGGDLIWVANGLLLAYLLLAPRWRWPVYLLAGFLALELGSWMIHEPWWMGLLYNLGDVGEILIAALLMRRRSAQLPRFTDLRYLLRFVEFAVLTAPMATGLAYALFMKFWANASLACSFLRWAGADGLGIAVITPIFVAIFLSDFRDHGQWKRNWSYLALTAVVAIGAFSQNKAPLVFLIYPLLVAIALRVEMGWAALAVLEVAAAGSWFTTHGEGPFVTQGFFNSTLPNVFLQLFILMGVFILYCISMVLDRQKATERKLQKIVSLYKLVTENSHDLIILEDFDGRRSYVSAAAEGLIGWKPEELLANKSFELVHPEDQPRALEAVRSLRSGRDGVMVECRARKRNGAYLWLEANLRLVHDPETGVPIGILNTVRDISERKQAEQKLQEAYNVVEALALTDGLTGLANRRRFDQNLTSEWRRGMREHQPLSLLMLDTDKFKAYNDTYGHQRGDSCLKQIAEACLDTVSRHGDLVARFGGDEFVITLPNTGSRGAMLVANRICEALRSRQLPHAGNPSGIVSISIGCATLIPQSANHATDLIALADHALYAAKRNGRNQVCASDALECTGEALTVEQFENSEHPAA